MCGHLHSGMSFLIGIFHANNAALDPNSNGSLRLLQTHWTLALLSVRATASLTKLAAAVVFSARWTFTRGIDDPDFLRQHFDYAALSHEGLMLPYEQALTRLLPVPHSLHPPSEPETEAPKAFYNTSAHFLWIGDRTRQLTGAHVEYFRGVRNPIGIKVGPSMQSSELVELLESACSVLSHAASYPYECNCLKL